jgi:NUMOD3 motif
LHAEKLFYTYFWLRQDGTPYYVGKGRGRRAIRRGSPKDLTCILIQEHPSEADAFAAEIFFIAYYGRKDLGTGVLRNRTDGGEGGANPSEETRRKIGACHKGVPTWMKGKTHTEEAKAKQSESHKGNMPWNKGKTGQIVSEETRQKQRLARAGRTHLEETKKKKIGKSKVGKKRTPFSKEWLQKMSEAQKRRYAEGRSALLTVVRTARIPDCHPERRHKGHGLCESCWDRTRTRTRRRPTAIEHPQATTFVGVLLGGRTCSDARTPLSS